MNKKIILSIVVIAVVIASGYAVYHFFIKKDTGKEVVKKTELYVCPMHPQIHSDHPGTCPICNMDLVLKVEGDNLDTGMTNSKGIGELTLSPSQQVLANVKTEIVRKENFDFSITANGVVKSRDDAARQISSPVKGKITKLYVNFEGQKIGKGQKAFEVYSPELIATQREYLLAHENYTKMQGSNYTAVTESANSVLEAAKQRLKLWFVNDKQIEELTETKKIKNSLTYYSDYSGVVTKKYINEGSWVMEGATLADVVNLSSVWVMANIYENELNSIRVGQQAEIQITGYGSKTITGRIDYINPFVNPDTRTVEVRVTVSNPGFVLKPEMYVKVKIETGNTANSIAVNKTAVLRTGKMDMVYVKKSANVFVPRNVEIAAEKDGKYLIKSGIEEGDEIVVSAGFLLDSESQIRMGSGNDMNNMPGMDKKEKKNDLEIKDGDAMKDMKNKNSDNENQETSKDTKSAIEHKIVRIPTAQCDICKENITKALNRVNGIKSFEVDVDSKIVNVNFDNSLTDMKKIEKAISLAGYDANNRKADPVAYSKLDNCCKKPEDRKK
jgi:membrane fusion protein, copper/silver efflux system